uniref:Uncharacterized protein n=1 Tax=Melanopsichium pennsylvanicum 4 TaxID=1398559 RepID=A0A077R9B1_9BASI|nr:uncharacterized protein BN887_06219 [Melanopsichium pennsylvanicum 4]
MACKSRAAAKVEEGACHNRRKERKEALFDIDGVHYSKVMHRKRADADVMHKVVCRDVKSIEPTFSRGNAPSGQLSGEKEGGKGEQSMSDIKFPREPPTRQS